MRATCRLALLVAVVGILWANSAHAALWIYATVWDNSDSMNHLVRIDVGTGATTDVGAVTIAGQPGHVPGLPGLSRHTDG